MIKLIVLLIVCFSIGLLSLWIAKRNKSFEFEILAIIIILCCGGIISSIQTHCEPTAMDVYKGKTTLEITYRDSIPIDSIVVFKE